MEQPFRGIVFKDNADAVPKTNAPGYTSGPGYTIVIGYTLEDGAMMLAKWGNSLAVRIPSELVEELNLKPGEKVRISRSGEHGFVVERDRSREEALEMFRKHRIEVPEGYVFNRDEIYDN